MIFSDSFTQVLKELSAQVERKLQASGGNKLYVVVELSVEAWCRKLNLSNEITFFTQEMCRETRFNETINYTWNEHKSRNNFINGIKNIFNMKPIDRIEFILVIAFVLTGIGSLLYLLRPQSSQKKIFRAIEPGQQPRLPADRNDYVLVLVISAENEDIIYSLNKNRRVMSDEGERLYRATQALWMGSKTELPSRLRDSFYSKTLVQKVEQSEYDVYFVQIEIYKCDIGFTPNANQLDRIDAFRSLHKNSGEVKVSPRLPSRAYENTDVYIAILS